MIRVPVKPSNIPEPLQYQMSFFFFFFNVCLIIYLEVTTALQLLKTVWTYSNIELSIPEL